MEMNSSIVKNKLDSISRNSQYVRVTEEHPLELYLGKNQEGNPTLRFNGEFVPVKVIGNNILEVKQVKTDEHYSVLFSYTAKENLSLFYDFCADLINQTSNIDPIDGYKEIINRFHQWKKMFSSHSKLLNENEILGLIGELMFLKNYSFDRFGITKGLNGWSGPESTHKDFSYDNEWFEIKSINSYRNAVSISSIEQLDSVYDGHVVIYFFEKMSPNFKGLTLNELVASIMTNIELDSDKDLFAEKLKQAGYCFNEVYDNYVYNVVKNNFYTVNDDFPRLKEADLPKGISEVQYEILLSSIEKFKEN